MIFWVHKLEASHEMKQILKEGGGGECCYLLVNGTVSDSDAVYLLCRQRREVTTVMGFWSLYLWRLNGR